MCTKMHLIVSLSISLFLFLVTSGYGDENTANALFSGLNNSFGSSQGSYQEQFQKITGFIQNNYVPLCIVAAMILVLTIAFKKKSTSSFKKYSLSEEPEPILPENPKNAKTDDVQAQSPHTALTFEETDIINEYLKQSEKVKK